MDFNNQMKLIEFACCLAYGTLSDPQNVDKTATEIKTSKQRSYTFVSDTQQALQTALEDLVYAMNFWAFACMVWYRRAMTIRFPLTGMTALW